MCWCRPGHARTMAVVSGPSPASRPLRSPRLALGGTLPATVFVLPVTAGTADEAWRLTLTRPQCARGTCSWAHTRCMRPDCPCSHMHLEQDQLVMAGRCT